jgi:peptidoglycan L-alanyl-D-glutamate endopeptidase CwlK
MAKLLHPEKLDGVEASLVSVIHEAVASLPFDCVVAEGLRSKRQAILNYCKGRTAEQLWAVGITDPPLPGPQVTWTLHSKHVEGKAVDIYPMREGKLDDASHGYVLFDQLYHAIMLAAAKRGVRVRYGGDWDMDGKLREKGERDSPHFELA